jgi:hypothetical protein
MKTSNDYRIERIRTLTLDGKKVKAFDAYVKQGDAFIFCGAFSAPARTANKNLWLIPNESDTGSVE